MFTEAWRLERDYFYDRNMHGVDWTAMKAKYLPLVDRVTDRAELSRHPGADGGRAVGAAHLRPGRRLRDAAPTRSSRRRSARRLRATKGRRLPRHAHLQDRSRCAGRSVAARESRRQRAGG